MRCTHCRQLLWVIWEGQEEGIISNCLLSLSLDLYTLTTQSTQSTGRRRCGRKTRSMMMRKEGSCRETRTSAQRHMSTPVRRMQMTVHPHQMMGEACKQKQDGGRFQIRINILIDRTFKANTIYII